MTLHVPGSAWIAIVASFLSLASCSQDDAESSKSGSTRKSYAAPPAQTIDASKVYGVRMVTSKGTLTLSLDAKAAPITVNNFVFLARDKFYDGLTFHRVVKGFVIQGGDPEGTGGGGPGYTIPDEGSGLLHVDGALAMAKTAAPDSAGSQFYITLGPQPDLDGRYTVFGLVTSGQDVVRSIALGDVIESVTITER